MQDCLLLLVQTVVQTVLPIELGSVLGHMVVTNVAELIRTEPDGAE